MPVRSSADDALRGHEKEMLRRYIIKSGNARDLFAFYMMAEWGMRVGELAHFQRSWLDERRGIIRIPTRQACDCYECSLDTKHPGFWGPKTKAGTRIIPARGINREAWDFIIKFLDAGEEGPKNRKRISPHFALLGEKAGIPHRIYPHCLRATAGVHISQRPGVTDSALMSIMGWERLETANKYIKASGIEVERIFPSEEEEPPEAREGP
jgi:integrase